MQTIFIFFSISKIYSRRVILKPYHSRITRKGKKIRCRNLWQFTKTQPNILLVQTYREKHVEL